MPVGCKPSGREALELGLALTPVGHDAFEEIPEARAVVREAEVAELVDDDVVDALDRGTDEVEVESQDSGRVHGAPARLVAADDEFLGAFGLGDIELHHAAKEAFLEEVGGLLSIPLPEGGLDQASRRRAASANGQVLARSLHALGRARDDLEAQASAQEEVRFAGNVFAGLCERVELAEVPHLDPDPVHALE